MNIGAPWPDLEEAELRVLVMQMKLHQWATSDPGRCFDDVFNLCLLYTSDAADE